MKIAIGADHRGFKMKEELKAFLLKEKHEVEDLGTDSPEPCDYPLLAAKVAKQVASGKAEKGILACKSGIGMSIAANKVKGVRAAVCSNAKIAKLSRQHNDTNVLVLGSDYLQGDLNSIVTLWMNTPFEGGRHERRIKQIMEIENT